MESSTSTSLRHLPRLVVAVCVCRPYAAKPIGASGDYRAWPSKDGKPQRPEAGQGSGPRAAPTREASPAMGRLPRRPEPRHTARPVKDRSTYPGSAATHEGGGGTLPPHGPPATASASSGTRVHTAWPRHVQARDRRPPAPRPGGPDLDAGALGSTVQSLPRREERPTAGERQADTVLSGSLGQHESRHRNRQERHSRLHAGADAIRRAPWRGLRSGRKQWHGQSAAAPVPSAWPLGGMEVRQGAASM